MRTKTFVEWDRDVTASDGDAIIVVGCGVWSRRLDLSVVVMSEKNVVWHTRNFWRPRENSNTIASITFHSSFPLSHGTATAATTATCIANLLNLWRCVLVDTAAFVRRILMIPHCRAGHKRKRYAHERSTNRTIRSRHNRQRTKRRRERIQEVSL